MDYVDTLEKMEYLQYQGKRVQDVGKKQQSRKLRMLKNRAQCALWFGESFGFKLSQINFKDDKGGNYSVDYNTPPDGSSGLSEDDQCDLEKVLFLLDKFCVGDECYHELSILSEDLPRSNLIKQKRSDLNKTYHIERTFVKDVNDLGITFSTWYKKNADGSRSNILEYTSCVGAQKKLLLCKLPSILAKYLYPDTVEIVCKIWNDFKIYYDFITDSNLQSTSADEAFNKAKIWIELFCSKKGIVSEVKQLGFS